MWISTNAVAVLGCIAQYGQTPPPIDCAAFQAASRASTARLVMSGCVQPLLPSFTPPEFPRDPELQSVLSAAEDQTPSVVISEFGSLAFMRKRADTRIDCDGAPNFAGSVDWMEIWLHHIRRESSTCYGPNLYFSTARDFVPPGADCAGTSRPKPLLFPEARGLVWGHDYNTLRATTVQFQPPNACWDATQWALSGVHELIGQTPTGPRRRVDCNLYNACGAPWGYANQDVVRLSVPGGPPTAFALPGAAGLDDFFLRVGGRTFDPTNSVGSIQYSNKTYNIGLPSYCSLSSGSILVSPTTAVTKRVLSNPGSFEPFIPSRVAAGIIASGGAAHPTLGLVCAAGDTEGSISLTTPGLYYARGPASLGGVPDTIVRIAGFGDADTFPPPSPIARVFASFEAGMGVNLQGQVGFVASSVDAVSLGNEQNGVYLWRPGVSLTLPDRIDRIVRTQQALPLSQGGSVILQGVESYPVLVANSGDLVFTGLFDGASVGLTGLQRGIWRASWDPSVYASPITVTPVFTPGQAVGNGFVIDTLSRPVGQNDGYTNVGAPASNRLGDVATVCVLKQGENSRWALLLARKACGSARIILLQGDPVTTECGSLTTIEDISLVAGSAVSEGRPGGLNSWGELGVGVRLKEIEQGGRTFEGVMAIATAGVFRPSCVDLDFNNDGVFPDLSDVIEFQAAVAGGGCSTSCCDSIDFNGDGVFPDNTDIICFLEVFSGGVCQSCQS